MNIKQPFDLFIVTCGRDIKLLRHFFLSYELFFRNPGKIHLFIWKKEEYLLDQINRPGNLVIHYKDAVEGLAGDDFRNQMYLKLISDQYVETNWYWVVDSDYLICSPLGIEDFFHDDSAYWFFRPWSGLPAQAWRTGSERLLGKEIPYLFMGAPPYVLNREVLRDLRASCDVSRIFSCKPLPSEFVIYGAFAYGQHHEKYRWVNLDRDATLCTAYLVNQRPPTYCVLDANAALADIGACKYSVFWSHWDLAEEKMRQFLMEAQQKELGRVLKEPKSVPIFLPAKLEEIVQCGLAGVDGQYADGWVKKNISFYVEAANHDHFVISLDVPQFLSGHRPRLELVENHFSRSTTTLRRGINRIEVPLTPNCKNYIRLCFSRGIQEAAGGRTLYAQVAACEFRCLE